jgi:hypothetical protein
MYCYLQLYFFKNIVMLDRIFHQNSLIIKKIDQLLSSQDNLENRIKKLEDDNTNKNKFDESFVNVIYKITLLCIKTLYIY